MSNFYPIEIAFNGKIYASAEHAFQAAKCATEIEQDKVRKASTAAMAKSIGRHVKLRSNWESEKVSIMEEILRAKFQNQTMKKLLEETKGFEIVEENRWHDMFWGKCNCHNHKSIGKNILGELLMLIRDDDVIQIFFNKTNSFFETRKKYGVFI